MADRQEILSLVKKYYEQHFAHKKEFQPGDKIHYAGRFFDEEELINLVDSSLDFWLTTGRYALEFEKDFAKFLGVKFASLANSGSSANLLAFMTLTSPKLGERSIKRGDEVITVACGFPTTVAPMIQYGAIPVFLDITIPQYNIDCSLLENALSSKTKAVMVAHTLGNPFDLKTIKSFCDKHNLWLIEDNCDALGGKYFINGEWKLTGTIGDIGTSSFYPAHHITMGEGGAVYTNNPALKLIIESFRDWGRDCFCPSGKDNTCHKRFSQTFEALPAGYDHKYIYSHFGYNLKVTDMQAAIGCAQLKKLPFVVDARNKNWQYLRDGLSNLEDIFYLPTHEKEALPSWFGFVLTVKENSPFNRNQIVAHLEKNNIQTRMLFAGNLLKHPCFDEMRKSQTGYRIVGNLDNTNKVMNNTFWIGVYPGMTQSMLDYMINTIREIVVGN